MINCRSTPQETARFICTVAPATTTSRGAQQTDVLVGAAGNDYRLTAGSGDDVMRGRDGRRYALDGSDGDDVVNGGAGDDTLEGGDGDDIVRGGPHVSGDTLELDFPVFGLRRRLRSAPAAPSESMGLHRRDSSASSTSSARATTTHIAGNGRGNILDGGDGGDDTLIGRNGNDRLRLYFGRRDRSRRRRR